MYDHSYLFYQCYHSYHSYQCCLVYQCYQDIHSRLNIVYIMQCLNMLVIETFPDLIGSIHQCQGLLEIILELLDVMLFFVRLYSVSEHAY